MPDSKALGMRLTIDDMPLEKTVENTDDSGYDSDVAKARPVSNRVVFKEPAKVAPIRKGNEVNNPVTGTNMTENEI